MTTTKEKEKHNWYNRHIRALPNNKVGNAVEVTIQLTTVIVAFVLFFATLMGIGYMLTEFTLLSVYIAGGGLVLYLTFAMIYFVMDHKIDE